MNKLILGIFLVASLLLVGQSEACFITGSITTSLLLIDDQNNILDGSAWPGQSFLIDFWSPRGQDFQMEFITPLSLTADKLGGDGVFDAMSLTRWVWPATYYYSQMVAPIGWTILGYNDQLISTFSALDDIYPFGSNLDSNGAINLLLPRGRNRELVVVAQRESLPVPEPGTQILFVSGSIFIGGVIILKNKRKKFVLH